MSLWRIRPMRSFDLPAVAAILRDSATPWTEQLLAAELQVENGLQLIAEHQGRIAGAVVFRYCPPESELLQLAVALPLRGQGGGSLLLRRGLEELGRAGIQECYLEVRSSNLTAKRFYSHQGFRIVGSRRGYYQKPLEDAVIMHAPVNDILMEGNHDAVNS